MPEIVTPRRVAHFDDPRMERQIDEIINFEKQIKDDLDNTKKMIEPDRGTDNREEAPDKPSKPQNITISSAFKKFVINWDRLTSDNIAGYIVSYSDSFDDQSTWNDWISIDVGSASFFIHDNLDPDYDYRYRIASYNRQGVRSSWTDIEVAGNPGKVSLSEEIIGNLDYENLDEEMRSSFENIAVNIDSEEEGISVFKQAANEISSSISELYSDDGGLLSTIQQESDNINFRVVEIDEDGNITGVYSQINIGKVRDGESYIYLEGDQITLDGDTNIEGDFELNGSAIINESIYASKYKEIRNVLPYNYLDSLDDSIGFICDFYIPSETVNIVSIKLSAKGLPFRAYSKGTAFIGDTHWLGGQHSHDIGTTYEDTGNPDDTVTTADETGVTGDSFCDDCLVDHSHGITSTSVAGPNHQHEYISPSGSTTGSDDGRHEHDYSHEHDINYGIYEDTSPADVEVEIDNGDGFNETIDLGNPDSDDILADEKDLTNYFTGTGWKRIRFNSSQRGRINAQLILKVDITA